MYNQTHYDVLFSQVLICFFCDIKNIHKKPTLLKKIYYNTT